MPQPTPMPAKVVMFPKPPPPLQFRDGVIVEAEPEFPQSIDEAVIRALPMPEHWIIETEEDGVPMSPALLALVDRAIDNAETWELVRAERGDLHDARLIETLIIGAEAWQCDGGPMVHGEFVTLGQQRMVVLEDGTAHDLCGQVVGK